MELIGSIPVLYINLSAVTVTGLKYRYENNGLVTATVTIRRCIWCRGQLEILRYFDHHIHFMTCTVIILSCSHVTMCCDYIFLSVNFM